jgi:Superfamily II DNA and RNA helicases
MNDQSFSSLGLTQALLSAVAAQGYDKPTPIQTASIPPLLEGRDLLGCAQTGTGKTAAFALPIIQLLTASPAKPLPRGCRALVVSPTRELAAQIDASFAAYSAGQRFTRACIFGGVGKNPQVKALSRGVDVLVATPGRLLDLQGEGQLRLDGAEIVVLDEADRMLDMGFIRDMRKIIALLPKERQTLLFSATMPNDIAGLANSILKNPVKVTVSPEKPAVELIDQKVAFVEKAEKRAYLTSLIEAQDAQRAIVFTRTKHGADRLAKSLSSSGIPAEAIHANKSQNNRTRTMEGFRSGSLRVLVATDLAARGIDVDGVSHVYNYELPDVPETYVHRIGRTARAGASGQAVALCDSEEKPLLKAIEKLLKKSVPLASGEIFDKAAEEGRKGAIADAQAKAARGPASPRSESSSDRGATRSRGFGEARGGSGRRSSSAQEGRRGERRDESARRDGAQRRTEGRREDASRRSENHSSGRAAERVAPKAAPLQRRPASPAQPRPAQRSGGYSRDGSDSISGSSGFSIDEVTGRMSSSRSRR